MNILTTITDGSEILRCSGTFGRDKTVSINHFAGMTYLHVKGKKNGHEWKTITSTFGEYKELVRMTSVPQLTSLESTLVVNLTDV